MNFLNLLTKEKRVAGIEISDSVVRIAFLQKKIDAQATKSSKNILEKSEEAIGIKKENVREEFVLIEEPIAANIIADGVVLDVDLLGKTLRNIWSKANINTNFAIVTIPEDKIYSKIFSFPKSVSDTRLTEAMRLAISFQLPMKTEDVYLDWEHTSGTATTNEIFLSTIPRDVAQGYINALEKAGIKTLALESQLSSIARAVKLPEGETVIFSKKTPDGSTIFAIKNGILRFSRTFPFRFVDENQIPHETEKVRIALSTETKGLVTVHKLADATVRDDLQNNPEITEPKSKWLAVLGAALRGKIPEGEDNLVSLLPIGTEEAYAYQKATTFIIFIRNLTMGISLFFVATYIATYLFMMSLVENTSEQIASLSAVSAPQDLAENEQKITDVNNATDAGAQLLAQTPMWSKVINGVLSTVPEGITISALNAPSLTGKISITGVAQNRATLNNYKATLQQTSLVADVDLPLTNLEQKGQIPFTISFSLQNPSALYYK